MLDHIMIDLETLATRADAAILSIGAVRFNPIAGVVPSSLTGDRFYRTIELSKTPESERGFIDPATVMWWFGQSDDARNAITSGQELGLPLRTVLRRFDEWFTATVSNARRKVTVWANDPDFDLCILQEAYDRCELTLPWSFRNARSMRTMSDLAQQFDLRKFPDGTTPIVEHAGAHNALNDAVYQAKLVTLFQQALQRRMIPADIGFIPITRQS